MTNEQFQRDVDADIRELAARFAPQVIVEGCAYCGGFGRVAIPQRGALLWGTRSCTFCGGTGYVTVEAA